MRAEGAESEVTWTWSNGRIQRDGVFDHEKRSANFLASNNNKKCMIVKNNHGKVSYTLRIFIQKFSTKFSENS